MHRAAAAPAQQERTRRVRRARAHDKGPAARRHFRGPAARLRPLRPKAARRQQPQAAADALVAVAEDAEAAARR
jgi:hypothetical protein